MAKKKKRDFWDDVEEEVEVSGSQKGSKDDGKAEYSDDGRFHPTKSLPLKIIMRCLLFAAAAVVAVSGYICYKYVDDRYDGGFTDSYFSSKGFSQEYNDTVLNVLKIVDAVEKDPTLADSQEKVNSLAEGILGTSGNFSFLVQDDTKTTLYASSEDAKDRIEASNHFMRISSAENEFMVDVGGVPTKGLNKAAWKAAMDSMSKVYIIYTAVDNNLTQSGSFYTSYTEYQNLTKHFGIAWIAAIVGFVLFILLLVFNVMATGMRKGYADVKLSIYDYVYTEFAAIISIAALGGIGYGMWFVHSRALWPAYEKYVMIGGSVLFYIVLIRSYFSLVRRIKTGRFVADSLIYRLGHTINKGLNHLPKVLKGIIVVLFLIALNAGLVLSLLYLRGFTIKDVPVVFVVAPLIFIIELIAFISCLFGGVPGVEEVIENNSVDENTEPENEEVPNDEINPEDWTNIDFGKAVKGADAPVIPEADPKEAMGMTQENILSPIADRTVMLSEQETNQLRNQYEEAAPVSTVGEKTEIISPEVQAAAQAASMQATQILDTEAVNAALVDQDETLLDFIQLNKDVRKMFRIKLKNRSIGVTLRAPEKPIMLDIDKSNAIKVLSILFDNVEKYAEEGSRVYIEMYTQKGKMVYMMKNTIRADLLNQVTGEMGQSLKTAKEIVQSEGGKFITTVDGDTFKAGILLTVAE